MTLADGFTIHVGDIPGGWATVIAALLATIGGPLSATWWSVRAARHAQHAAASADATKQEVKNDHPSNLRDDLDGIRDEMRAGFQDLKDGQKRHDAEIGRIRDEMRDLRRDQSTLREDLEDTRGHYRKTTPRKDQ